MKKLYEDRQWLAEQYEKLNSIYKIAKLVGCHPRTIHSWLEKFNIPRNKHFKHSEDSKRRISESQMGKQYMLGKKHSQSTRLRMSANRIGAKNSNWKGGRTERIRAFRKTKEYIHWRNDVLKRAKYKCEECGNVENLEAHHIISVFSDISKALDVNNGKVLCSTCHKEKDWRKNE